MLPNSFQRFDFIASGSLLAALCLLPACSSDDGGSDDAEDGDQPVTAVGNNVNLTSASNGNSGNGSGGSGSYMLPPDYTETEFGGYKLGEPSDGAGNAAGGSSGTGGGCGTTIVGVVRDFRRGDRDGGHADFETFTGDGEEGIVEQRLGDDRKPVYVDERHRFTTNRSNFDEWYNNVENTNMAYAVSLSFEPNGDVLTFHSSRFFPIDGVGFGNEDFDHNYHFTTEVHTAFVYHGGETFTFTGDDDLWVFINGNLAIDLGGLHPQLSRTIDIDDAADRLDLDIGGTYDLDLFHAERHTGESNFRVETNLAFTNCGEIIDPVVK